MENFITINPAEQEKEMKTVPAPRAPKILPILHPSSRELHTKLDEVQLEDLVKFVDVKSLFRDLIYTMQHYRGVGLSANQVGLPFRVFVMSVFSFDGGEHRFSENIVCLNPEILDHSGVEQSGKEGCLSHPGLALPVKRYTTVNVGYTDEFGQRQVRIFNGLNARIFQHELDHMNGIDFTERVTSGILTHAMEKQRKFVKAAQKRYAAAQKENKKV
jgi:peptide deformylase